jgi:hypothetical protein
LQLDLFDERNLISLTHEDYPGERLIACRNPALAKLRAEKRQDLIAATTRELEKVAAMVAGGRLKGAGRIGARAGKVIDKYKVAKHFDLTIADAAFAFKVKQESVATEAALDGLYRRWSGPSARSKASTSKCARSATAWRHASRPHLPQHAGSSACWPTTCSGT